jgi:hypothetical protein
MVIKKYEKLLHRLLVPRDFDFSNSRKFHRNWNKKNSYIFYIHFIVLIIIIGVAGETHWLLYDCLYTLFLRFTLLLGFSWATRFATGVYTSLLRFTLLLWHTLCYWGLHFATHVFTLLLRLTLSYRGLHFATEAYTLLLMLTLCYWCLHFFLYRWWSMLSTY